MIFAMPLPHILKPMTIAIATMATSQLAEQLVMAEEESVRPMAMMIGPVTIGGKKRMTFFTPKALKSVERTTYMRPAAATPTQA